MVRPLLLTILFLVPWGLLAAPVASLVSLEGEVTVYRAGLLIPSEKVSEGFLLEAFDTVTTGALGRADVRLPGATGVAGFVRLDPETSFYLDIASQKKVQTVGVELLYGAVTVQPSAVTGSSLVEVRTAIGTFGGAVPGFRVVETSGGDILASSSGGRFTCRVDQKTVYGEPGTVVEVQALDREVFSRSVNVSTLNSYEMSWIRQRNQVYRDQVATLFRAQASRYQLQLGLFQRAWDRVQRELADDPRGAAIANLRRAAFPLERSQNVIKALRKLFDEGVLAPSVELSRGYAAKDFFRQAAQDGLAWGPKLIEARGLYKSLAERLSGDFPLASDGSLITWDSDFFH